MATGMTGSKIRSTFREEGREEGLRGVGSAFAGAERSGILFRDCDFSGADLSGAAFEACRFEDCNLSNPDLSRARFVDAEFDSCKLAGLAFHRCDQLVLDISFFGCRLVGCNFSGMKMKRSRFLSCELEGCWFQDAFLQEADFTASRFRDTLFHGADLQKAVFLEADGYAIDPRTNKVRKAVFGLPGALSFLDFFGIVVK